MEKKPKFQSIIPNAKNNWTREASIKTTLSIPNYPKKVLVQRNQSQHSLIFNNASSKQGKKNAALSSLQVWPPSYFEDQLSFTESLDRQNDSYPFHLTS